MSNMTPLHQYPRQISPGGNPGEKKLNIWQNLSPGGKTLTTVENKINVHLPCWKSNSIWITSGEILKQILKTVK